MDDTGFMPPERFAKGYAAVKALHRLPRYQAAFVFGSVAEGTSTSKSDLDVKVVVDEDVLCDNINHPTFDDYKLDVTFRSFPQIKQFTDNEIKKGEREPNLARGVIIFDKTGELTKLQDKMRNVKPQRYSEADHQFAQFMLYHANNKVERFLKEDPENALYSMHANIGEVLKIHFKLQGQWWVSSKNVLKSLDEWDRELAHLVRKFVSEMDVTQKYHHWSSILDRVAETMGGLQPIAENNCRCEICEVDLRALHR